MLLWQLLLRCHSAHKKLTLKRTRKAENRMMENKNSALSPHVHSKIKALCMCEEGASSVRRSLRYGRAASAAAREARADLGDLALHVARRVVGLALDKVRSRVDLGKGALCACPDVIALGVHAETRGTAAHGTGGSAHHGSDHQASTATDGSSDGDGKAEGEKSWHKPHGSANGRAGGEACGATAHPQRSCSTCRTRGRGLELAVPGHCHGSAAELGRLGLGKPGSSVSAIHRSSCGSTCRLTAGVHKASCRGQCPGVGSSGGGAPVVQCLLGNLCSGLHRFLRPDLDALAAQALVALAG
mmetsp:Transcript_83185/g.150076  ORF Transcript_83185/g.150076 Transcript_83185/m.150076 type:complete len:300 (-) Transcript_83185:465-1364(-)